MHRYLITCVLIVLLAVPAAAQESCDGDSGAMFPGLTRDVNTFGIQTESIPAYETGPSEESCDDTILLDMEPRPGMLVKLVSAPKTEELICAVNSEVIETYRARLGNVDYLLAPDNDVSLSSGSDSKSTSIRIAHVITSDPDYISPEGLRVGDTVERALSVASKKGTIFTTGGLCLVLPSGWTACFDPTGSGVTPGGHIALAPSATILDFHLM